MPTNNIPSLGSKATGLLYTDTTLDAFVQKQADKHFANICGYNAIYVGERLAGYDKNYEAVVGSVSQLASEGISVADIDTALNTLHVKHRIFRFDGNYRFGDSVVAILCKAPAEDRLGHAVVIRRINGGYQLIDPPSTPKLITSFDQSYSHSLAIYLFRENTGYLATRSVAEDVFVLSLVLIAIAYLLHFLSRAVRKNNNRRQPHESTIAVKP